MKSIKEITTHTLIIKKSEFICTLIPCNDEKEIKAYLQQYSKDDANHNCSAYIVNNIEKANDDGEPSGTAGLPMLNVLQRQGLCNVIVIVTRYFGGIKLGAGGLTRAYTNSVAECLKEAEIIEKKLYSLYEVHVDYHFSNKIDYLIKSKNIKCIHISYQDDVTFQIYLNELSFIEQIKDITANNFSYNKLKDDYI